VFTTPLITRSDGKKFGKSEDGALFLDASLTSPYALYQYFYNVSDQDAIRYLEIFSFLDQEAIATIAREHEASLGQRIGQKALAEQLVKNMHGEESLREAQQLTDVFFTGAFQTLTEQQLNQVFAHQMQTLNQSLLLEDILVTLGAASSKREAREFIVNRSITVNGHIIDQIGQPLSLSISLHHRYFILRRGKKHYYCFTF
jgi:tyrosyl-tRNA synthetase